jgi:hypothetical protein
MADSQRKPKGCSPPWIRRAASSRGSALAALAGVLLWGCVERQELFAGDGSGNDGGAATGTVFHLISIGANAQDSGIEELSGLGAAIILRGNDVLFWGNGGGVTTGRGFTVAVINPSTAAPVAIETFDTFETRASGGAEAARLAAFLDGIEDGMLVLSVVGDDAGLNENGVEGMACTFLDDDGTRRALAGLAALGSSRMQQYCYRASWAMAAYQGRGRAEAEQLVDDEPAHVTFALP